MSKKNNLLVAASGTGGHIFPALAVSKEVEDEWSIHWLGVTQRIDEGIIKNLFTTIRNDDKKIDITFKIPDRVLTGSKYDIDIILNKPLE